MGGKDEEALKYFDKALEIDPENVAAWNNKCVAFYRLGKNEEALKCIDKALEIDPNSEGLKRCREGVLLALRNEKIRNFSSHFLQNT